MADKVFMSGMVVKKPENAPSFVKCKISFKVDEFTDFLNEHNNNGWVNADLKVSKDGKLYAELNAWKKGDNKQPAGNPDYKKPSFKKNDNVVPDANETYPSRDYDPNDPPF